MPQTVLKDKKGMTLIEVVIALLVLLIVFLALMQTALVGIDANMLNVLRDEAVNIAEQRMNELRNTSFDNLNDTNGISNNPGSFINDTPVQRDLRNISSFPFAIARRIDDKSTDNKQIDVQVTWTWKETPYTHTISTIMRRQ